MSAPTIAPDRLPTPGRFAALAALGLSVIPIRHPDLDYREPAGKKGKKPICAWARYQQEHPLPDRIRAWERDPRTLNVAVVTGEISSVTVVDVDSEETLVELKRRGHELPETPTVRTGRGYHYYYRAEPGATPGNSTELGGIHGLDVRGNGGYVVAPGSVHESGRRYEWITPPGPDGVPYAPLPAWVHELRQKDATEKPPTPGPSEAALGSTQAPKGRKAKWAQVALDAELSRLRAAKEGSRNKTLNRSTFALAQIVAGGSLDAGEVRASLRDIALGLGLTADEVEATLDSAWSAGSQQPRTPASKRGPTGQPVRSVLVPGAHTTEEGEYIEQGTDDFAAQVLAALPPGTFYRWERIVGEIVGRPGRRTFRELTADRTRLLIDRHARLNMWVKGKKEGDPPQEVFVTCHRDYAGLVLAAASTARDVRELRALVHHPVFAPGFALTNPGWNEASGILYDEPPDLVGLRPSATPDTEVLNDLTVDFPFRDAASLINLIGLMLTPLIRPAVATVPIHLVQSSIERTGKGLLINSILGNAILGAPVPSVQLGDREEEREKRITAMILEGTTTIHLDNLPATGVLDSPSLCALVTSTIWKGRLLGSSAMPPLPNTLTVIASANNLRTTGEVAKRIVPIWLEPATDTPETRTDFQHQDILGYATEKRREVLACLLGMIAAWVDAGKAPGARRLGGFEGWAAAIGGVLELYDSGTNWLANRGEWSEGADEWTQHVRAFVAAWDERWGATTVTATDLLQLAGEMKLFPEVFAVPESGRPTSFGRKVLNRLVDRPVGAVKVRKSKGRIATYYLVGTA